ncbi:MAG: hypothetical protein IH612_19765 [Desulfofustis sp.]|nr:hypothetical protein [Desulfofustis sp.]
MNGRMIDFRVLVTICVVFLIGSFSLAGADPIIGEDGLPIAPGEEITNGVGIIDEISFSEGFVLINDLRFEITETTELIDKRRTNAAPGIFIKGTRVVWTAKGGRELLSLDHYPFDQTDPARQSSDDQQETDSVPGASPSNITRGSDGVFRN